MRQQATGLVFTTLLLLSVGNEILTRSKKTRHEPVCSETSDENATNSPPSDDNSTLHLLTNPRTNLVGLLNVTNDIGLAFDLNRNYVGIFCGTSGWFTVINLETKLGVYVLNDTSPHGWFSIDESFGAYFKNLTSLEPLYSVGLKIGTKFGPGNINKLVALQLQLTINGLSNDEFSVTQPEAFKRFLEYSTALVTTVKGPLKGILNVLGDGDISTSLNIRSLPIRLQGLASISSRLRGGFSVLANIRLDWHVVFNTELSCDLLIYIFSQLNTHNIDAGSILRSYSDQFIVLLNQLAGNSSKGINGLVRIISEVHHLALGQSSIGPVLDVLIEYFGHPGNLQTNYEEFIKEIQVARNFIEKLGATKELKSVVGLIDGLTERKYEINGINLYEVVKTCVKSSAAPPLHHIVQILEYIREKIRIEVSTGILLYRLIILSLYGSVNEVVGLVPAIKIDYTVDIPVYIFHGVKTNGLSENLYNFLASLRIFGPILEVINDSLESFSYVPFDELFASPYFRPYIQVITRVLEKVTSSSNVQPPNVEIENDKHLNTHHGTQGKHLTATKKEFQTNHLAHNTRHKEEYHSHGTELNNRLNTQHETKHQEIHHGSGKQHANGHTKKQHVSN